MFIATDSRTTRRHHEGRATDQHCKRGDFISLGALLLEVFTPQLRIGNPQRLIGVKLPL